MTTSELNFHCKRVYIKHMKLRYGSLFLSVHMSESNNMLNLMGSGKNRVM